MFILLLHSISGEVYKVIGTTINVYGPGEVLKADLAPATSTSIIHAEVHSGVTILGSGCFSSFSELKSVNLPETLTEIKGNVFQSTKLVSLFIPKSVAKFKPGYLVYADNYFSSIIVDQNNTNFASKDGVMYNKAFTKLILVPKKVSSLELPNTLLTWGGWAGYSLNFPKITIPASLQTFQSYSLVDSTIGEMIFEKFSACKTMSNQAFWQVNFYSSFTCPPNLTDINPQVFKGSNFSSFICTEDCTLQKILASGFESCTLLTTVILPKTFSFLNENGFDGCYSLNNITILNGNPNFLSYKGSLYTSNKTQLIFVPPSITEIEIPVETDSMGTSVLMKVKSITAAPGHASIDIDNETVVYSKGYKILKAAAGTITSLIVHENCESISKGAFSGFKSLTNVSFAGTAIKSISVRAFLSCSALQNVNFSSSIKYIKESAFQYTAISKVVFPISLLELHGQSFYSCASLKSIDYEEGCNLIKIGVRSFNYCGQLSSVRIPDSVQTISDYAFMSTSFQSLVIPKSLENITNGCFMLSKVVNIYCDSEALLKKIFSNGFNDCSNLEYIEIPPTTTTISASSFLGCKNLKTINWLTSSVNPVPLLDTIEGGAFQGCTSIVNFTIYKNLQKISQNAFLGCTSFVRYVLAPDSDDGIFEVDENEGVLYMKPSTLQCSPQGKTSCTVREGTKKIESNGFYESTKLVSIDFGQSEIETIGESTFYHCTSLLDMVIPASVVTIMKNSFLGCSKLRNVTFSDGSLLEELSEQTFTECFDLAVVEFVGTASLRKIGNKVFEQTSLKKFVIPSNVTSIGEHSFKDCVKLQELSFGNSSIEEIPSGAFTNCESLVEVDLPECVKIIGNDAFSGCSSLLFLRMPGVSELGDYSFYGSKALEVVRLNATVASIGRAAFANCPKLIHVYYCGSAQFSDGGQFDNSPLVRVFTLDEYSYQSFCGITVEKIMRKCGVLPSANFSAGNANHSEAQICFASILCENSSDC